MRGITISIPRFVLSIVCLVISVFGIYRVKQAYIWQRKHITNLSVKQAVDKIPFGVCYYNNQGRILLINQTMTNLCEEIIGESVQNGIRTFEKILSMGPVIHMSDDRAISVQSQKCIIDTEEVELVTAFDITEEYKKTNILMAIMENFSGEEYYNGMVSCGEGFLVEIEYTENNGNIEVTRFGVIDRIRA